uniref:Uncharacterized protein n=1 Tax=Anguilla anguilla TaxID=7936 RepID=A0A0E9VQI8_ANGAN
MSTTPIFPPKTMLQLI